jgi:hypothetical protein
VAVHSPAQLPNEAEGHHVWPLGYDGPDIAENMRWLCPTTHTKVHNLWREWVRAGGEPPWDIMRRYSGYVRGLVADGWSQVESAGRVHAVRAMMTTNDHDS